MNEILTALGTPTPDSVLYKAESHKLHQAAKCQGKFVTLTFSAALVASNTIDGYVNGVAMEQITYATDSDTTMAAIAAAIATMNGVKSAAVVEVAGGATNDRVINIFSDDVQGFVSATGFVVAAGASQATITIAAVDKNIYKGMPVQINSDGNLEPVTAATYDLSCVGIAMMDGYAGKEVSFIARGYMVVRSKATGDIVIGAPVKYSSWDSTGAVGYPVTDDASVTVANQMGWALESAADGDIYDVLVKD